MSWNEGYVSDVAYAIGYYREMSPSHLSFVALSNASSANAIQKPQRILELGFGMGLSIVLSAASNPLTYFEGYDFNPEHVSHAQEIANDAGLTNLKLRESSFQDVAAEAAEGQHDLDIIQLHGILTWVSAEAHEAIVEIARKRLKPGGFLYVSYNCMPGWASFFPTQRLMREYAKLSGGSSIKKTSGAVAFVKDLASKDGKYFSANPVVKERLEKLSAHNASYLAHEYMNENWFIFHFAEVAEMMSRAKLSYLASATIAENMDGLAVPKDMRRVVAEATDSIWKETLRDFAANKQFRRDVYTRGKSKVGMAESLLLMERARFTLAVPRQLVKLKFPGPMGEIEARADVYSPLLDALAIAMPSFTELTKRPSLSGLGANGLLEALSVLIHSQQVFPIVGLADADFANAKRTNRVIVDLALRGRIYNFLAAPAVGSGINAPTAEILALGGIFNGVAEELNALVDYVCVTLDRLKIKLFQAGNESSDRNMRDTATDALKDFVDQTLPLWRHLGVC